MCSTGSKTTTTAPNPGVVPAVAQSIGNVQTAAATPYAPYTGETVAPNNPEQGLGIAGVNNNAGYALPFISSAQNYAITGATPLTQAQATQYQDPRTAALGTQTSRFIPQSGNLYNSAAQPLTDAQIQNYYNPYQQDVVAATQQQMAILNAGQFSALQGNAASQGALGGDREGVAAGVLAGQQAAQEAPILAGLEQTGYNQAVQTAMAQYQQNPEAVAAGLGGLGTQAQQLAYQGYQGGIGTGLTEQQAQANAAYSLGNLGVAGQNAALQGNTAQINAGTMLQQTQQQIDTANQQAYWNQFYYPEQQAQYQASNVGALAPTLGGTVSQPGPSVASQVAGYGTAAIGLGMLMPPMPGATAKHGGAVAEFAGGGAPNTITVSPEGVAMPGGAPPITPASLHLAQPQQQSNSNQQALSGAINAYGKSGGRSIGTSLGNLFNPAQPATPLAESMSPAAPEFGPSGMSDMAIYQRGGGVGFADGGAPISPLAPTSTTPPAIPLAQPMTAPMRPPGMLGMPQRPTMTMPPGRGPIAPPMGGGQPPQPPQGGAGQMIANAMRIASAIKGNGMQPDQMRMRYGGLVLPARNRIQLRKGGQVPMRGGLGMSSFVPQRFADGGTPDTGNSAIANRFDYPVTAPVFGAPDSPQEEASQGEALSSVATSPYNPNYGPNAAYTQTNPYASLPQPRPKGIPQTDGYEGLPTQITGSGVDNPPMGYNGAGMPTGGLQAPVATQQAADTQNASAAPPTPSGGLLGGFGSRDAGLALMSAGFGMLGSGSPFASVGIGQGAQQGLQTYLGLKTQEKQQEFRQKDIDLRVQQLAQQAKFEQDRMAQESRPYSEMTAAQKAEMQFRQEAERRLEMQPVKVGTDMSTGTDIYAVRDPSAPSGFRRIDASSFAQPTGTPITPIAPTTTPPAVPSSAEEQLPATASPVSGETPPNVKPEVLATLDPQLASQVKALDEGRMAFPTGFALKSPYWQNILRLVSNYDPSFDAVNYNARAKTRADFVAGKSAQNITSFNTAIGHLGTLDQAIDGLGNYSMPFLNSMTMETARQTNPQYAAALNSFQAAKTAVTDELTRAFRGSGGNVHDIMEWSKALNAADSPQALHAAVKQAVELLRSRIESVGDQYNRGMGTTRDSLTMLSPHAQETVNRLSGTGQSFTGRTATNSKTGQKLRETSDGQWVP